MIFSDFLSTLLVYLYSGYTKTIFTHDMLPLNLPSPSLISLVYLNPFASGSDFFFTSAYFISCPFVRSSPSVSAAAHLRLQLLTG
jgi:hypothetical protein